MTALVCVLCGYCFGMLNPSFALAHARGFDIRTTGSGNAGAANAMITMGKLEGGLVMVFDIAKAYFATMLTATLFPAAVGTFAITGTACILGHIFPVYMGLRGGKGTACLIGLTLAFSPLYFLVMLIIEIALLVATDYLCLVPTSLSVILPVAYGFATHDVLGALVMCVATVVVFCKHMENFRRMRAGIELRFSYIWNPEREFERIQRNTGSTREQVEEILLSQGRHSAKIRELGTTLPKASELGAAELGTAGTAAAQAGAKGSDAAQAVAAGDDAHLG